MKVLKPFWMIEVLDSVLEPLKSELLALELSEWALESLSFEF